VRYPGGAAVVCLLAAVLCGSPATVFPYLFLFIYFIMCSVGPYKVDIELVKVNVTYSYKWEIKL